MDYTTMKSPLGTILIARNDAGITAIQFESERRPSPPAEWNCDASALSDAVAQLREYFAGERRRFELPLAPGGTDFQRGVWSVLVEIPYGETRSYGEIAARIGAPSASRAVGAANGRNPIAIVIPCHRVIGTSGSLTGYAGGLEIKRALLELEGHQPQRSFRPWGRSFGFLHPPENRSPDPLALPTGKQKP
ncbi:MAG: methylated-DNA--[protein]-cysteine S-methyltransferase [Acidobacteria bacterium]|nr:methylated-DNA--[protein]-cysteine S-methyltransferase [Acidobacteriota bacterium]